MTAAGTQSASQTTMEGQCAGEWDSMDTAREGMIYPDGTKNQLEIRQPAASSPDGPHRGRARPALDAIPVRWTGGAFRKREPQAAILPDGSMMKPVCWENCHTQIISGILDRFQYAYHDAAGNKTAIRKERRDFQRKAAAISMPMTGCTG